MSLFEDLGKQVLGNVLGGKSAEGGGSGGGVNWMQIVMSLINQSGGIEGLLAKFQSAGLGDIVNGWIKQGPNPPVSPDQVKEAFGPDLQNAAAEAGTDVNTAAKGVADVLPKVVDQLSPSGQAPSGEMLQEAMKALMASGGLGKLFG